jgi:hypothetical protein
MAKLRTLVFGVAGILASVAALAPQMAVAQSNPNPNPSDATTYAAGVDLGRSLLDPRQCTGSGEFRDGCVDGVTESRFDKEADQALGSDFGSSAKPAAPAPVLSPPPDLFHDPLSKPDDGTPPNN